MALGITDLIMHMAVSAFSVKLRITLGICLVRVGTACFCLFWKNHCLPVGFEILDWNCGINEQIAKGLTPLMFESM